MTKSLYKLTGLNDDEIELLMAAHILRIYTYNEGHIHCQFNYA